MLFRSMRSRDPLHPAIAAHRLRPLRHRLATHGEPPFAVAVWSDSAGAIADALSMLPGAQRAPVLRGLQRSFNVASRAVRNPFRVNPCGS